jgi:hypothetical protein
MHDRWQDPRADALVGADAKAPGATVGERGQVRRGRVDLGGDGVGMAHERFPGLRQPDAPAPAGALEQALPNRALERGDLLADGALRVAEGLRRSGE